MRQYYDKEIKVCHTDGVLVCVKDAALLAWLRNDSRIISGIYTSDIRLASKEGKYVKYKTGSLHGPQEYPVETEDDIKGDLELPILEDAYKYLSNQKKYTKAYHIETPKFTKQAYKGIWYDLLIRIEPITNGIYTRRQKKKVYVHTKEGLARLCEVSLSSFEKFYREAYSRNYIGKFLCKKNGTLYILNPKYCLNGNKILLSIYHIFNS